MGNVEKYLLHCAGIYTMLAWIEKQTSLGTGSDVFQETVFIPPLGCRYFALGASRKKKVRNPFLAIQPNEAQWIEMISWEKVVIRKNDSHLYLISSLVKGDEEKFPDIPSFALAIEFDTMEKLDLIKHVKKLECREFFIDTDDCIRVNYHSRIFNLPLILLDEFEPYLENQEVYDYSRLLSQREQILQARFDGYSAPTYQGQAAEFVDEESKKLFEKFKEKVKDK